MNAFTTSRCELKGARLPEQVQISYNPRRISAPASKPAMLYRVADDY